MILVKPIIIDDGVLLSSSIPEPDASVGEIEWVAGTYNLGQRVIKSSTHREYQVVASPSTDDDPELGVNANPATWVDVGPTNRFKMFDTANNTQSESSDIVVELQPNQFFNGVGAFSVSADTVTITVTDGGNVIYSKPLDMRDRPLVNGWYNYFFSSISFITRFILLDLPPTTTGILKLEFGGSAKVGTVSFGRQSILGVAQYGTSAELLDFSNPIEDQYGNITYSDGFTAKLVNFDIKTERTQMGVVFSELQSIGKNPAIWVGDNSDINDATAVFGINRDYQQTFDSPSICTVNLTVRGLV